MNKVVMAGMSQSSEKRSTAKIVSILSGKGGVGKSVFACNLAERAASLGYRVLLVDADFSLGNVHILTNTAVDHGVGMFAFNQLSLKEVSTHIAPGLDILVSEANRNTKKLHDAGEAAAMMKKLCQQATEYDLVLLDHGSGKSDAAVVIALASDMNILLVVPELTSLADGFGLFKHLIQTDSEINCSLVVNRTESDEEGENVYQKFSALAKRFLNRVPPCLGYLPEDQTVKESVSCQRFFTTLSADSVATQSITKICHSLVRRLSLKPKLERTKNKKTINQNQAVADIKEQHPYG